MSDRKPSRGFSGAVLKLMRAGDYEMTVTGRQKIGPYYLRLSFTAGGMLADKPLHPTQWIRMWFNDGEKLHQRGYTLVDPDPVADTVDIEFALHDGPAARWAQAAQPGDTIEVTVLGSNFGLPDPRPAGYVIVGDTASLPAINSLLAAIGDAPTRIFLEAQHEEDKQLPVLRSADVHWVDRKNNGEALIETVAAAAFDAADHFGWVACDNRTTRAVAKVLREDYKIPKKSIKAQGYWEA
ncbi:siderophore-interacting protein [Mycobacterium sp. WMMD1722]|uniref:siderophore-interacting protein n=1 Tax=Mycobacterium sp. WMMD1722 TaxID=3404117 RepID=UPI003BF4CFCD